MSIGRVPGITGIQPSIVDAKGDLIVATAADSVDRLAVGANNTVLTADSSTATGLKWATPSSGSTGVGVLAVNTTSQTINNATDTILNLNDEYWDTDSFHNPSTNNSRLTIPSGKGGYYLVYYKVTFASSTSGERYAYVKYNGGATIPGKGSYRSSSAGTITLNGSYLDKFVAGDYIELVVYQSSGGSLGTDSTYYTNFGLIYVGA